MGLKLIDLKCCDCGSTMKVNSELEVCNCNYCGKQMLLDKGNPNYIVVDEFGMGFDMPKEKKTGRIDPFARKSDKYVEKEYQRKKDDRAGTIADITKCAAVLNVILLIAMVLSRKAHSSSDLTWLIIGGIEELALIINIFTNFKPETNRFNQMLELSIFAVVIICSIIQFNLVFSIIYVILNLVLVCLFFTLNRIHRREDKIKNKISRNY